MKESCGIYETPTQNKIIELASWYAFRLQTIISLIKEYSSIKAFRIIHICEA